MSLEKVVVMVLEAKSSSRILRTAKYKDPQGASLGIPLIISLDSLPFLRRNSCTYFKLLFLFRQKIASDSPRPKSETHRWKHIFRRKGMVIGRIEPDPCGDLGVVKVSGH